MSPRTSTVLFPVCMFTGLPERSKIMLLLPSRLVAEPTGLPATYNLMFCKALLGIEPTCLKAMYLKDTALWPTLKAWDHRVWFVLPASTLPEGPVTDPDNATVAKLVTVATSI